MDRKPTHRELVAALRAAQAIAGILAAMAGEGDFAAALVELAESANEVARATRAAIANPEPNRFEMLAPPKEMNREKMASPLACARRHPRRCP